MQTSRFDIPAEYIKKSYTGLADTSCWDDKMITRLNFSLRNYAEGLCIGDLFWTDLGNYYKEFGELSKNRVAIVESYSVIDAIMIYESNEYLSQQKKPFAMFRDIIDKRDGETVGEVFTFLNETEQELLERFRSTYLNFNDTDLFLCETVRDKYGRALTDEELEKLK